ncbi:alpha/beta hydrolase [soil metagenome]
MSKDALLLHGGFAGAWEWQGVIEELSRAGITARAIDLPSKQPGGSLADDEKAVRQELDGFAEPVVLVGHSFSGAVIGAASAGNDKVAHLVYVAAAKPDVGQSVMSSCADAPQEPVEAPTDGSDWMEGDDATKHALYSDLSDEEFAKVEPNLQGHSGRVFTEIVSGQGWKEHPYTYVVATLDQIFPVDIQRRWAADANHVVEIEAGHAPMAGKPAEVAAAIAAAANA